MANPKTDKSRKKKDEDIKPRRSWRDFFREFFSTGAEVTPEEALKRNDKLRFGLGGVLFIVSVFTLLSIVSHIFTGGMDQSWAPGVRANNWMGTAGMFTSKFFVERCFGIASLFIPLFLVAASLRIMRIYKVRLWKWFINCTALLLLVSAFGDLIFRDLLNDMNSAVNIGGNIGHQEILIWAPGSSLSPHSSPTSSISPTKPSSSSAR